MRRNVSSRLLLLLLVIPIAMGAAAMDPAPVAGQGTGELVGLAVTGADQPLAGVNIELHRADVVVQRVQTDASGTFRFASVPAGIYDVVAQLIGYNRLEVERVQVVAGETRRVRLAMVPAPVELPELTAVTTPIRISRADTDFGRTIQSEVIRALPVSHKATDLVELTPGARAGHVWGGATQQANNYQLDGVAANHPGIGGDLIEPSINWVESIEVRGLGAGAEHGNFQGGLINVITKSGTNEFQGALRANGESHRFNASGLGTAEIGSEISTRYDVEGEVRGPILRDRLFFYLAGQRVTRDERFINHLPSNEDRYLPTLESRSETKLFGKLTWQPMANHQFEGSVARLDANTDHYGLSGYETAEATLRVRAPTTSYTASWRSQFGAGHAIEARIGRFESDERRDPYEDVDRPGALTYGFNPPHLGFSNAPLRYRHAPESTGGTVMWLSNFRVAGLSQQVKMGVEHNVGSFIDQRIRNGGMTWRPSRLRSLDPADASTWFVSASPLLASVWGGEVDLHAEVENSAAFVQTAIAVHPRVTLTPGARFGRWVGHLLPGGRTADRFEAIRTSAWEPRLGVIYDLTGDSTAVVKAHWGRYHQNLIAQMFERAEGGHVFTDEELWYYRGDVFTDPGTRFTREQRDQLAQEGDFVRQSVITLTETGPPQNYKQPFVDQWILGFEKTWSDVVKFQALYVNRRNRNMVALVDLNRATNYTVYDYVRVRGSDGQLLPFEGGTVQLQQLHVPNWALVDRLRCTAAGTCPDSPYPPGLVLADTARLTWDPQYVLTNAPDAQRKFDQLQVSVEVVRPSWSVSVSGVITQLEGNLDNVTGYDDPSGFGAGPYVRVNEGVNSYGKLPNYADREMKVSFFGNLPWGMRGGVYWTRASGDHFAPYFTITTAGAYSYEIRVPGGGPSGPFLPGPGTMAPIDAGWLTDLEGHRVFIGPRGLQQHHRRAQFDLRLERELVFGERGMTISLDIFNIINSAVVTDVNRSVNRGQNFARPTGSPPPMDGTFRVIDPAEFYRATRARVAPRTLRLSTALYF